MKALQVVVGIIVNNRNQVLLDRRPDHLEMGGWWEFPGGKVEGNESTEVALKRELEEEIGIKVLSCRPFHLSAFQCSSKWLTLEAWWVESFEGKPQGLEGQVLQWLAIEQLTALDKMLERNQAIVQALQKYCIDDPIRLER